jgi:enoyl-CoA hydratase
MAEGDFRIGLPEMAVGIIPGAGGTQRLARALGPARALELILEARPVPPEEAVRLGLVHRVVPPDRLLDEAHRTAERLARRSPATVRAVKRAVYDGASGSLAQGLQLERTGFVAALSRPAAVNALRAYLDQLERLPPGALPGTELEEVLRPWQDGTAVDMTDG